MNRLLSKTTSVRARLTIWNTITFALVLIALGVVFRFLAQSYLLSALDRDISAQAKRMQEIRTVRSLMFSDNDPGRTMTMKIVTDDRQLQIRQEKPQVSSSVHVEVIRNLGSVLGDRSGQFQYRSFDLDGKPFTGPPIPMHSKIGVRTPTGLMTLDPQVEQYKPWDASALERAAGGQQGFVNTDSEGTRLRVMSLPLRDGDRIIGTAQIAASLAPVYRDIAGLTRALFLILPPALLIAVLAGVFLTDRALRPVKALTMAATRIRPDQLAQRLPVSGADEFDELAATFNRALGRVEVAFVERERMVEQLRRFTGDASHELRTPLTTIKANTGVALSEDIPSLEHIHALRQIDRAANRMTNLVEDLLLLARSDSGQLPQIRTAMPIVSAVREAVDLLPNTSPSASIDIRGCSEAHQVSGDADQLVRLFRNLLENAVRYTPADGSITVDSSIAPSGIQVRIRDTGAGIAKEHLDHLGERFYRADSGRNRQQGGAGLGLAICRSIVAQHNGEMKFESEVGVGTTVAIVLSVGRIPSSPLVGEVR